MRIFFTLLHFDLEEPFTPHSDIIGFIFIHIDLYYNIQIEL